MRSPHLAPGSLLADRFEIERLAGSGGMGSVYRARDLHKGGLVALKVLHQRLAGSGEVDRFLREAQFLSELRHPGIVSYADHGQTPDGQHYLAMEWLEGEDLGQRLARGPLPVRACLSLLGQVTEALAVAHGVGVLHRDFRTQNCIDNSARWSARGTCDETMNGMRS